MKNQIIFASFNLLVLPVWFLMIAFPKAKLTVNLLTSFIVPILLAGAYGFLIFPNICLFLKIDPFSLSSIQTLFSNSTEELIMAAWFHFLSFDLLVGSWILKDSQKVALPHLAVIFCLLFTFGFGPLGFMLYQLSKLIHRKVSKK